MNDIVDRDKSILVPYTFNSVEIVEIEYEGKPVFLAQHVGAALGYSDPDKLANNVVQKWSDDFEEGRDFIKLANGALADFKAAVNCSPNRGAVKDNHRPDRAVVDPRASHLILLTESGAQLAAILSRTPQGRAFRRWLIDVVLPAWRARKAPPGGAPPAAAPAAEPSPRRTRGPRPKALPAVRTLADHARVVDWEMEAAQRFNRERWLHPWGGVREHLMGQIQWLLADQSGWGGRPHSWRLQIVEELARHAGLPLATFEGDPDLAEATEKGLLMRARLRELVERMSDVQLVFTLAALARQVGAIAVIDVTQLRTEGWRWTPGRDVGAELARMREELSRATRELDRLTMGR